MNKKINLMIVDEYCLLRECLAFVLAKQEDFAIVDLAEDAEDAFDKANAGRQDVVLININLPGSSAFELVERISFELSRVKTIISHVPEAESVILRCIEAGAQGYVLKESPLQNLITTIRRVYMGETVCSPRIAYRAFLLAAELSYEIRDKQAFEYPGLTVREAEILRLIAGGLSNKQMAERLYLSFYTVKNHVHTILEKLGVNNRLEAVHYALDRGLLRKTHTLQRFEIREREIVEAGLPAYNFKRR